MLTLLTAVRTLGISITAQGDDLLVQPASRLTPDLRAQLRAAKSAILAHLRAEATAAASPPAAVAQPATRSAAGPLPLPGPSRQPDRKPSWSDPNDRPQPGVRCHCCHGTRFWTEATTPRGWRCATCHPPLPGGAVRFVRTNAEAATDGAQAGRQHRYR
jgi:hypothetical protein